MSGYLSRVLQNKNPAKVFRLALRANTEGMSKNLGGNPAPPAGGGRIDFHAPKRREVFEKSAIVWRNISTVKSGQGVDGE